MLEKIKSKYIYEKVFDILKEKRLLKLVNYNKSMQTKLNKKLSNYKIMCGKYFIYDENKKGRIYDAYDIRLIIEGGLINNKRNGKGIEYYDNGNILYDGEYKNGKWNGRGYEYYSDGDLKYEGEYLNGKRNGKGKGIEYNNNVILEFDGECLNNKIWNGNVKNIIKLIN